MTRERSTTPADPAVDLRRCPRSFVRAFERGSDRLLHVLYDDVAAALDVQFEGLRDAGAGQMEVLRGIAEIVGLSDMDFEAPLADVAGERLARRVAWRDSARWTVLSLLWTLTGSLPVEVAKSSEWARLALSGESPRPRAASGLSPLDERVALAIGAARLAEALSRDGGRALLLRDRPVAARRLDDGRFAASEVRPLALAETSSEPSDLAVGLRRGDRVLLASPAGAEPPVAFDRMRDEGDGVLTVLDDIEVEGVDCLRVVRGLLLLFPAAHGGTAGRRSRQWETQLDVQNCQA